MSELVYPETGTYYEKIYFFKKVIEYNEKYVRYVPVFMLTQHYLFKGIDLFLDIAKHDPNNPILEEKLEEVTKVAIDVMAFVQIEKEKDPSKYARYSQISHN